MTSSVEKDGEQGEVHGEASEPRPARRRTLALPRPPLAPLLALFILWLFIRAALSPFPTHSDSNGDEGCDQVEPWDAKHQGLPAPLPPSVLAKLLSGAVRVNTSVYDDYPLPVSAGRQVWEETFAPLRDYLRTAFPKIHSGEVVELERVNEHGLLYTWRGTDSSLKPIVFMAHQDVVPVDPDTLISWTYPPFSGHIDEREGLVYGRGASDDKASLISLLASFESLLVSRFEPQRSLVLSFGFDEEASGTQGGEALASRLEDIYGSHKDGGGVYMVVDEGESVDAQSYGIPVAAPAVGEKGYLDVKITVKGKGGHSSDPPAHTTIGLLSKLISHIEDNPWKPTMRLREDGDPEDSLGLTTLLCLRDAPSFKGTRLGKAMNRLVDARQSLASLQAPLWWPGSRTRVKRALRLARQAFLQAARAEGQLGAFVTTQAVDVITGGVKINALPEEASALINHRINTEESVQDVRNHLCALTAIVAEKYGCEMVEYGSQRRSQKRQSGCTILLEDAFDSALEPAPRTPTKGPEGEPFRLLSSVIRATWKLDGGNSVRVVPSLMQGNTDTKSYHRLSQQIFRFSPGSLLPTNGPVDGGIHTVDEQVQIDSLTQAHRFYTMLMTAVQG